MSKGKVFAPGGPKMVYGRENEAYVASERAKDISGSDILDYSNEFDQEPTDPETLQEIHEAMSLYLTEEAAQGEVNLK